MTISQYLKWQKMNFGHFLFTFTKNNGNRKWESLIFLRIKKECLAPSSWHSFLCIFCNYSEPHLDSAALHLDVASRHMKFQKRTLIHASMIRVLFWNFAWLWIVIIIQKKGDCRNSLLFSLWSYVSRVISFSSESPLRKFCLYSRWRRRLNFFRFP